MSNFESFFCGAIVSFISSWFISKHYYIKSNTDNDKRLLKTKQFDACELAVNNLNHLINLSPTLNQNNPDFQKNIKQYNELMTKMYHFAALYHQSALEELKKVDRNITLMGLQKEFDPNFSQALFSLRESIISEQRKLTRN